MHNNDNNYNNVMQSNVNLSPLALPYSRIPLVQGGVYYLPCGGWVMVSPSSKEKSSHPRIEPPTPLFGFGYLAIVIH
jgi:hypothetical protein